MYTDIFKIIAKPDLSSTDNGVIGERYMRIHTDTQEEAIPYVTMWVKQNLRKRIFSEISVGTLIDEADGWNTIGLIDYIIKNNIKLCEE